jgi:hypothetical protein
MSYEIIRPLGDDPWGSSWNAMECIARGPGFTWSNGQCVPAATAGWAEVACRATGGNFDPGSSICCPANEFYGPGGCTAEGSAAPVSWEETACAVFGGYWEEGAGACMYPPSSEGLVEQSRAGCEPGHVQTSDGRCLPAIPIPPVGQNAQPPEAAPVVERSWWQRQPDSTKVLIVGGTAAAGLVLLAIGVGAIGSHFAKNPPRRRRRKNSGKLRRRALGSPRQYLAQYGAFEVTFDPRSSTPYQVYESDGKGFMARVESFSDYGKAVSLAKELDRKGYASPWGGGAKIIPFPVDRARKPRAKNPSTRREEHRRRMTEPHYTGSFKDAWVIYDPSTHEYEVKGPAPYHDRVAGVYRSRKAAFRKARSFTTAAEQKRWEAWLRRQS